MSRDWRIDVPFWFREEVIYGPVSVGHSAPSGCGRLGHLLIINIRESERELKRLYRILLC
jgi:hypothetical protein